MKLYEDKKEFNNLSRAVAKEICISESNVRRDFIICCILFNLSNSQYKNKCVFKGGTSLSKCYPNSIKRFSEDIDLTYLGMDETDKKCEKEIKKIELLLTEDFNFSKIDGERSKRSKSSYVWFDDENEKVKLEIGSSVRPDPYGLTRIRFYIHTYLLKHNFYDIIEKYEIHEIELNVLNIERTFLDKVMAIKRHAYVGDLDKKVRHIYDVKVLFNLAEIQDFLKNTNELKRIIKEVKSTDSFYLKKRNPPKGYNPREQYNLNYWIDKFDVKVKHEYESLHKKLLFSGEQQYLEDAINVLRKIDNIFKQIEE